jgi:hypothetical protein
MQHLVSPTLEIILLFSFSCDILVVKNVRDPIYYRAPMCSVYIYHNKSIDYSSSKISKVISFVTFSSS